jgi:hypothetical protein
VPSAAVNQRACEVYDRCMSMFMFVCIRKCMNVMAQK